MVATSTMAWSSITWMARRPWIRWRLRRLLAEQDDQGWRSVWDLARAAGFEAIPSRELQLAITDLVDAGVAEALRGPRGWTRVRPSIAVLSRRNRIWHEEPEPEPAMAAPLPPSTLRSFSVTARVPRRQGAGLVRGITLWGGAALFATLAVLFLYHTWTSSEASTVSTRDAWYDIASRSYAAGNRSGQPGFELPYEFTAVTGVAADAPLAEIERGLREYIKVALFTGYPSRGGILAWARTQYGEPPDGEERAAWLKQVADAYTAKLLAGETGFALTPLLMAAGGIRAGEQDPAVISAGLATAIDVALSRPTPQPGGILEWARLTFGDLPRN